MPRRPTGRNTIVRNVTIKVHDDRAAQAYADKRYIAKSTVYVEAMAWYLDNPDLQGEKEVLTEAERRALERWRR